MDIQRKIVVVGGNSKGIVLPPDLLKYLDLDLGDEVTLRDERGKYGVYVSFWKNEREENEPE